ncbi:MAG TPA: hypothetical protein VLU47_10030, partial [Blastocatellia bacterium]|nr:hypothetical protein [Blastocatellia bacterium]
MTCRKGLSRYLVAFMLVALLAPSQLWTAMAGQKPAAAQPTSPQGGRKFELTIDNIMRGSELVGYEPRTVRWSQDGPRIYCQWKQASEPRETDFDTYVVNRDGSGLRMLTEDEVRNSPPVLGELSKDKKHTVFIDGGDVFLYDHATGRRRKVTATTDVESNPRFTRDQRRVYFTRGNNLFVMSLDTGSLIQMTDIRIGGAPPPPPAAVGGGLGSGQAGARARAGATDEKKGTDSQEYLKKEERELLDAVKRRAQKREEDEAKRKRENPRKPFNMGSRQSIVALQLTPDEKTVIANVNELGEGGKNTIVPNYVTEASYTEDIGARTKVGDSQSRTRIALLSVETGEVKWLDHGQKLPPEQPEAKTRKTEVSESTDQPRKPVEPREREVQL